MPHFAIQYSPSMVRCTLFFYVFSYICTIFHYSFIFIFHYSFMYSPIFALKLITQHSQIDLVVSLCVFAQAVHFLLETFYLTNPPTSLNCYPFFKVLLTYNLLNKSFLGFHCQVDIISPSIKSPHMASSSLINFPYSILSDNNLNTSLSPLL